MGILKDRYKDLRKVIKYQIPEEQKDAPKANNSNYTSRNSRSRGRVDRSLDKANEKNTMLHKAQITFQKGITQLLQ